MNIARLLVLSSVAFVAACSSPSSDIASTSDAIQGGVVDEADPAVGFVWYNWGDQGFGFCTATLITPTVVLTAAHCLDGPIEGWYTGTGAPVVMKPNPVTGMVRHAVKAQAKHPTYDWNGGCPNVTLDVALVELAAPVTDLTPLPISTSATMPAAGAELDVVGYGDHTANGKDTYEQKRSGTVSFVDSTATSIQVTFGSAIADSGDSGGPLISGGTVIGATTCHSDGDYPQHKNEFYARVDAASAWIEQQIAAWQ